MSLNTFTEYCRKCYKLKMYNFSKPKAEEIYATFKALVSVLPKDELTKLIISPAIELNTPSQNI